MEFSELSAFGGVPALNSKYGSFSMDTHIHDEYVIAAYFDGQKAYASLEGSGVLGRGDFLVVSPGVAHSARSDGNHGCQYLAIYPTIEQVAQATDLEPEVVQRRLDGIHRIGSKESSKKTGESLLLLLEEEGCSEFTLSVFLSDLLTEFPENNYLSNKIPDKISDVWERIYEEPLVDFQLGDLASDTGVSKEHLCRSFKLAFGISPFQLLRARRTAYARELIRNGATLADAAADSGFSDQSHMSRWFKRIYGASPKLVAAHQ